MTNIEKLKARISLRGIVMTLMTVVVAGLAIATLRYQPSPPDVGAPSPAQRTTAPVVIPLPPPIPVVTPTVDTPTSTTVEPTTTTAPPVTRQTFIPTQEPTAIEEPTAVDTPTSSAPPTSSSAPPTSTVPPVPRSTNPTLLPNGGRRFGTVQ
ncbi:hypothetical protein [Mycolicibacterium sp. P1-5]|uniref:hypothetical protein n=1 Tax=Mycolicibacterium sp. P1-5 TaxID=2024617 RepID=UPI0011EE6A07|nr:hypothetical protein [Mycolicibacterium sp. P1-5]